MRDAAYTGLFAVICFAALLASLGAWGQVILALFGVLFAGLAIKDYRP